MMLDEEKGMKEKEEVELSREDADNIDRRSPPLVIVVVEAEEWKTLSPTIHRSMMSATRGARV
jgi:hypothetical protein